MKGICVILKGTLYYSFFCIAYSQFYIISPDSVPVKYAVVWSSNKTLCISDSSGRFDLEVEDTDSIYFRHVAYHDTMLLGKELRNHSTIIMRPRIFLTSTVVISSEENRLILIGNDGCKTLVRSSSGGKRCVYQYFPNPLGNEKKIRSLLFKVGGGGSKCALSVNLYEVIRGDSLDIQKPLLGDDKIILIKGVNVPFSIPRKLEIDISEHNITLPVEGIFVKLCGRCEEDGYFYYLETAIEKKIPMYVSLSDSHITKMELLPIEDICCFSVLNKCYLVNFIQMKVF